MTFEAFSTYLQQAVQSDFFAGGVALGVIGVLAALLRAFWQSVSHLSARRFSASVTVDSRSASYRHFLLWLRHSGVLKHVRQLSRINPRHAKGTYEFAPAPGRYFFWFRGRLYSYYWFIDDQKRISQDRSQDMMETLTITAYFGSSHLILGWIEEGKKLAQSKDKIGPGLHVFRSGFWDHLGEVPSRRTETVVSEGDQIDRVIADMRWFYGAKDWYVERGVPWRRGYLLHGPPGTGKSSLIRALASELNLDIATMDVGRVGLTDDDLREAMMDAPKQALLAIEDIDAVFVKRDGKNSGGISFSGLLNAIDGVAAQEGRALVMTTNHIDKLDPALIRPGRADIHVELGLIGAESAAKMFRRFFPENERLCDQFRDKIGDTRLAPSTLQGWLLLNAHDPEKAAEAAFLEDQTPLLAAPCQLPAHQPM